MIGLIAATGFTGSLIAEQLKESKADFLIAGRNQEALNRLSKRLGGIETRLLDLGAPASLSALGSCRVLINCAGPYSQLGEAVVKEAISRKMHYLDLTGEQAFIKLVYDKYGKAAQDAGLSIIPACAFEYALADAAAEIYTDRFKDSKALEIIYAVDGMHTSPGTRKSILRALEAQSYELREGKLEVLEPKVSMQGKQLKGSTYTLASFGGGEALMLPKHTQVGTVRTYLAFKSHPYITTAAMKLSQTLAQAANFLENFVGSKTPTKSERLQSRFLISISDPERKNQESLILEGTDPYGLTAIIAAHAAEKLLASGPAKTGAISPAMLAGAELLADVSKSAGVKWTFS